MDRNLRRTFIGGEGGVANAEAALTALSEAFLDALGERVSSSKSGDRDKRLPATLAYRKARLALTRGIRAAMTPSSDGEARADALDTAVEMLAMGLVDPEELGAYAAHHERETRRQGRERRRSP